MDPIKEAFSKIKEDISLLKEELALIRKALLELYDFQLKSQDSSTNEPPLSNKPTNQQTNQHIISPLNGLYSQNMASSTGNEGVPTNKPTNQQTNQHNPLPPIKTDFEKAKETIASLDQIKQDIRAKFKNLTPQEMTVFSLLYSLENQGATEITYKVLATRLNLSESSIRDYINKISKKGIPIDRIRQNNKVIYLKISSNLRTVASLETILSLRAL